MKLTSEEYLKANKIDNKSINHYEEGHLISKKLSDILESYHQAKVKENELLHNVSCNWIALNKNTGSWVKYENLHIDQMLDKVMMLEDGNLANYEIYEHNI